MEQGLVEGGKKGTTRKFKRSPRKSKENSKYKVEESSRQKKRVNEESMEVDEFEEPKTKKVKSHMGSMLLSKRTFLKRGAGIAPREEIKQIAWNCHGLGNNMAICGLLNVQKEAKTKMDRCRVEGLSWKIGMKNVLGKDCNGKSGGLAVFWKRGVNIHTRAVSRLYMDVDVTEPDGFVWRFTGFYYEPSAACPKCSSPKTLALCWGISTRCYLAAKKEVSLGHKFA